MLQILSQLDFLNITGMQWAYSNLEQRITYVCVYLVASLWPPWNEDLSVKSVCEQTEYKHITLPTWAIHSAIWHLQACGPSPALSLRDSASIFPTLSFILLFSLSMCYKLYDILIQDIFRELDSTIEEARRDLFAQVKSWFKCLWTGNVIREMHGLSFFVASGSVVLGVPLE